MKKNYIYMVGTLLSAAILTFSCAEDNIPSYKEMALDKTDVFIQADGNNPTAEANIIDGNGNYKITVADENIATATLNGNRIIFNGLKNGTTTATVMDWAKHSAVITIKVKEDFELKLSKEEVNMFLGENNNELVTVISGNGEYQLESSNSEVAIAELNKEGKISITALTSDFCDITVTDADGNKATVKVAVYDEHLVLEDITGKACIVDQTIDINITSGNGDYTIVSETPGIATAEVVNGVIRVSGISKGEASFTITDRMKLTTTVKVQVAAKFEIETTHLDYLWIGETQEINIVDGSGNYTIEPGSSITCTPSGRNKLVVNGTNVALNQTIKVTDNIFKKTITITVGVVNYPFETYGVARWYVKGALATIPYSYIETEGEKEHIKVGTAKSSTNNNALNGFHLSFKGGRGEGVKTDAILYTTKGAGTFGIGGGGDDKSITITDLEIVKREYTKPEDETNNKGKFWIRFREAGKEEYSYIITWF